MCGGSVFFKNIDISKQTVPSQVVLQEFSLVEWTCLCFLGLARARTKYCL